MHFYQPSFLYPTQNNTLSTSTGKIITFFSDSCCWNTVNQILRLLLLLTCPSPLWHHPRICSTEDLQTGKLHQRQTIIPTSIFKTKTLVAQICHYCYLIWMHPSRQETQLAPFHEWLCSFKSIMWSDPTFMSSMSSIYCEQTGFFLCYCQSPIVSIPINCSMLRTANSNIFLNVV